MCRQFWTRLILYLWFAEFRSISVRRFSYMSWLLPGYDPEKDRISTLMPLDRKQFFFSKKDRENLRSLKKDPAPSSLVHEAGRLVPANVYRRLAVDSDMKVVVTVCNCMYPIHSIVFKTLCWLLHTLYATLFVDYIRNFAGFSLEMTPVNLRA